MSLHVGIFAFSSPFPTAAELRSISGISARNRSDSRGRREPPGGPAAGLPQDLTGNARAAPRLGFNQDRRAADGYDRSRRCGARNESLGVEVRRKLGGRRGRVARILPPALAIGRYSLQGGTPLSQSQNLAPVRSAQASRASHIAPTPRARNLVGRLEAGFLGGRSRLLNDPARGRGSVATRAPASRRNASATRRR